MKTGMGVSAYVVCYLAVAACIAGGEAMSPIEEEDRKCEEITIPMCRGIGYNLTYMPNQFLHDTQEEAGLEVHQFWPLVEIKCSEDLKFFLCSLYTPICMPEYNRYLPACRSVCERAKTGCAPLMQQYGFSWPERMDCKSLPEYGDPKNLCMDFRRVEQRVTEPSVLARKTPPPPQSAGTTLNPCACECRQSKITNTSNYLYGRVHAGGVANCAVNCTSPYFTEDEANFTRFWLALWATVCLVSTLITNLTFLIDTSRFHYPERPIVFVSMSYSMVAVGFFWRVGFGYKEVACSGNIVHYGYSAPPSCIVVFIMLYFFSMAAALWWVVLTFTWFLAAVLKWGQEAIDQNARYFHLVAWFVPTAQCIAVLASKSVDSDNIAGLCYVGNQDKTSLVIFIIAPLSLYLGLGTVFLVTGIVSLCRIRKEIRQQGRVNTHKLERLMLRIVIFSVLYTVPTLVTIGCHVYELQNRYYWEHYINCPCSQQSSKPDFSVFMLKYLMFLLVGITSGFWVWSRKTCTSWKNFFGKIACCCNKSGGDSPGHSRCIGHHIKYTDSPLYASPPYRSVKTMLPNSHV